MIETVLRHRAADLYDVLPSGADAYGLQEGGSGLLATLYGQGFYLSDRGSIAVSDPSLCLSSAQCVLEDPGAAVGPGAFVFTDSAGVVAWDVEGAAVHTYSTPSGWVAVGALHLAGEVYWIEREDVSGSFSALDFRLRRASLTLSGVTTLAAITATFGSAQDFGGDEVVFVATDGMGYVGLTLDAVNHEITFPLRVFLEATGGSGFLMDWSAESFSPSRRVALPRDGDESWFAAQSLAAGPVAARLLWSGTAASVDWPLEAEWHTPPPSTITVAGGGVARIYGREDVGAWHAGLVPGDPPSLTVAVEPHPVEGLPFHLFPMEL